MKVSRELEQSFSLLRNPHEESSVEAERGMDDWVANLPEEEIEGLLDPNAGKHVEWLSGIGWRAAD